jgi:hypothetical protein
MAALPEIYDGVCQEAAREIDAAWRRGRPLGVQRMWITGLLAGVSALVEASALRTSSRQASVARIERYARWSDSSLPFVPAWSRRARAYAYDATGRPERAL